MAGAAPSPKRALRVAAFWRAPWVIPAGVLGAALIVFGVQYLPQVSPDLPKIRTDYSYFLPNMLAGDYWFARNGPFAVPWGSPAFCGGLPYYANPQSFYYSVPQWLSFIVSPLTSVRVTIILYAALGAGGVYLLVRRSFRASTSAALFGAVLFLFNGFYSTRMMVGHFAFHPFMLVPAVAAVLLEEGSTLAWLRNGLWAGLLIALMIQSGMVVILPQAIVVVAWIGLLRVWRLGGLNHFLAGLGVSLGVAVMLSASKLYAASSYLAHFAHDRYSLPGIPSVGRLLAVVAQILFWRADPQVAQAFVNDRVRMALHEWEYGLSPIPVVVLSITLVLWVVRQRQARRRSPGIGRWGIAVALVLGLLLPLALNYFSPEWNKILGQIPILNASQGLSRWFAVYIPILSVVSALALDTWPVAWRLTAARVGALAVIAFQLTAGKDHIPQKRYHTVELQNAWADLHKTGQVPPVTDIVLLASRTGQINFVNGQDALTHDGSFLECYEPIFGYSLQKFPRGTLHIGPVHDVTNGALNVKNPACFLYPTENGCSLGAEYPVERQGEADAFLDYRPVPFEVPPLQTAASAVNVAALFLVPAALLGLRLLGRRRAGGQAAGGRVRDGCKAG